MKKKALKNKRLTIVSVITISLLALGAYTLKDTYNRPTADPVPLVTAVENPEISANGEKNDPRQISQQKTTEAELLQPSEPAVDAKPSIQIEKEVIAENPLKTISQFASYRYNPSPEAIDTVSSFLGHEDWRVASEAIEVLRYIALTNDQSDQQEIVAKILKAKAADPSYNLRDKALYAAAEISKEDVLPIVAGYINNTDETTQTDGYDVASRALAIIRNQETVAYVKDLLSKVSDLEIRRNCYETLANINSYDSLSVLTAELQSAEGSDQTAGAMALSRTQDPEGIAFLTESIQKQKFNPDTIAQLSYSPAAPDVFDRLLNNDLVAEEEKIALLDTIAEYSVEGNSKLREGMTDMLLSYLENSNNSEMKALAIRGIGEMGEKSAPEIMQSYFDSDNADLREIAVLSFVNYTNPSNYESLFDILWDEDENVRRTAMVSLERFAGAGDMEMLKKAAQHDDEFIRKHASTLLSELN